MGQLLVPALVGAGVGAVGGAATGQNPFKAALLGAGLGAGGAGLMGAGAAGGAGAAAGTAGTGAGAGLIGGANLSTAGGLGLGSGAAGATGGLGNFLSSIRGIETAPVSMGTGGYAALGQNALTPIGGAATGGINFGSIGSNLGGTNLPLGGQGINLSQYANPLTNVAENSIGIGTQGLGGAGINLGNVGGADITRLAVNTPLSLGEQFTNMIGNPFTDLTPRDKLGLGLQGASMLNQPPQQMQTPPLMPITRGNPEMVSSPLFNVAPNVGMQEGNELGLPNLLSRMPLTEEELLRLQQQMQTAGFRGR
jgi:hypothetical protein